MEEEGGRSWPRALALLAVVLGTAVFGPVVLVGIPLAVLVLVLPARRAGLVAAAAIAVFLAFQGIDRDGLWFAERGWAVLCGGWFAALTLRFPESRFTPRGLGSVAGATAVAALVMVGRPGAWATLDWAVADRIRAGIAAALGVLRQTDAGVSEALTTAVYDVAESQAFVFPSLVALSSMAGLGVAWWLYLTLGRGRDGGLGPMRDFAFNDQLIWVLVAGLALLALGGSGALERTGWNAVVFMGGLYALRGLAVIVFMMGGISLAWGVVLAVGMVFVAPVIVVSAAVVGLGDTWLRVRERARGLMVR